MPLVVRLERSTVDARREILKSAAGGLPPLQLATGLGDAASRVWGAVG
jgi:hypothetical protein